MKKTLGASLVVMSIMSSQSYANITSNVTSTFEYYNMAISTGKDSLNKGEQDLISQEYIASFDKNDPNSLKKIVKAYRSAMGNTGNVSKLLDSINNLGNVQNILKNITGVKASVKELKTLSDWLSELITTGRTTEAYYVINMIKYGKQIAWNEFNNIDGFTKEIKETIQDLSRSSNVKNADLLLQSSAISSSKKYKNILNTTNGKDIITQEMIIKALKNQGVTDDDLANQNIKVAEYNEYFIGVKEKKYLTSKSNIKITNLYQDNKDITANNVITLDTNYSEPLTKNDTINLVKVQKNSTAIDNDIIEKIDNPKDISETNNTIEAKDTDVKVTDVEKLKKVKAEQGKVEKEQAEKEKAEKEKVEKEKAEKEKAEKEKAEKEKAEKEKAEKEKAEKEKAEKEKAEREKAEREKAERVSGELRGFFSAISQEKESADFGYAEIEKGGSLISDSKIITRFGDKTEGLKNDTLTTGKGDHLGNYQYVAIGKWSSPNNKFTYENDKYKKLTTHNVDRGYWVFGKMTKALPKKGSASFLGDVFGYSVNDNNQVEELDGDISLNVDFETQKIGGKLKIDYANKTELFSKVEFGNGMVNLSKTDGTPERLKDKDFSSFFDAEFNPNNKDDIRGDLVGAFYGDKVQEAAGVWEVHNNKGNGTGVFRAKNISDVKKVETGKYRGFYSSVGTEKYSADFDYAELEKDGSLTTNSKIVTRFGNKGEGLKNDILTTGSGDHLGDYKYVGLGKWRSFNNTVIYENDSDKTLKTKSVDKGYWVFGEPTKTLPKTGSASFLGDVFGYSVDDNNQVEELDGDIGLKVDFNTQKIAGKMNVNYANKNKSFAKVKFSNGMVDLSQKDDVPERLKDRDFTSFFDGEFVSNDENAIEWGDIVGAFYGDKAQEAAGVWEIRNENANGAGVFRAKQTTQSRDLIPEDPNKVLKNWKGFYSSARKETKGDNVHFSMILTNRKLAMMITNMSRGVSGITRTVIMVMTAEKYLKKWCMVMLLKIYLK